MASSRNQLFELDRKMELKVRLAVKNAQKTKQANILRVLESPEKETLDKLIARVRSL